MTTSPPAPTDDGSLRPLDLAQVKALGPLVTATTRLWRARPGVLLSSAFVVAFLPIAILASLQFLWDDPALAEGAVEPGSAYWLVTGALSLLQATVIAWLITATHVRAVLAFASGEDLPRDEALRRGAGVLGAVAGAMLLLTLAVLVLGGGALGILHLIAETGGAVVVPAVLVAIALLVVTAYVVVLGAFAMVVPAAGEQRGLAALKESARVVRGAGFWRTLGLFIVIYVVAAVVSLIPGAVVGWVATAVAEAGGRTIGAVIGGMGRAIVDAAAMSWIALASALLFFSHRARIGEPWQPPAGARPLDIAVGPGGGGPTNQPGSRGGQPVSGHQQPSPSPQGGGGSSNPIFTKPGQAPVQPQAPNDEPPHFEPPR